jgi:hypothetical protein
MRRSLMIVIPLAGLGLFALGWADSENQEPAPDESPARATGIVFHDANGNRDFDDGEKLLAGIRVSNGREIVKTDENGRYELPVDDDTILFVIKPRGWRTPISKHQLPRFYYVHKPNGSPESKYAGVAPTGPLPKSVDFPLYPQEEPEEFKALLFGDPQPRDQKEVDYIAHDVVEELIGTDASFGVTLGDIVFDDLSLFEPQAKMIALLGIPWYNVIGNHDINLDAKHRHHHNETFERVFGPSYYSFDYGPVHFLVLDDIEWVVDPNGGKGRYQGGLGEEQMGFIKNDLAMIPEDQLVVLMMHIPLMEVRDRLELYRLIEQRPFCMSISAHKHIHEHRYITHADGWRGPEPHHHVINVTVSGSWWQGAPDERGIPHAIMADGAPNGYSIISFDGHKYSLEFRAAGRSKKYQMQIHAPDAVSISELDKATVFANVFNGSEKTQVEMRLGETGEWTPMRQTREADPTFLQAVEAEKALGKVPWRNLPKPAVSTHLWKANLQAGAEAGTYWLHIRAREEDGRVITGQRVIRIEDPEQPITGAAKP